jgi:hypothetical protein
VTVNPQQTTIAEMRVAAELLEKFNNLYEYHRLNGDWSPKSLRYEADYLERNP